MKKKLDVIGKARRRVDGRSKVTGALRYADDLRMPRMLHAKLLRSPHPACSDREDRYGKGGEASRRSPGAHRQGLSAALRHHAGVGR